MSESIDKTIDAIGLYCPEPIFRTKIELEKMQVGQILAISADDPAAKDDITRWVSKMGHELLAISEDDGAVTLKIKKIK